MHFKEPTIPTFIVKASPHEDHQPQTPKTNLQPLTYLRTSPTFRPSPPLDLPHLLKPAPLVLTVRNQNPPYPASSWRPAPMKTTITISHHHQFPRPPYRFTTISMAEASLIAMPTHTHGEASLPAPLFSALDQIPLLKLFFSLFLI